MEKLQRPIRLSDKPDTFSEIARPPTLMATFWCNDLHPTRIATSSVSLEAIHATESQRGGCGSNRDLCDDCVGSGRKLAE
jgi:hypothetical protein